MTIEITETAFGSDAGGTWGGNTFWISVYVEDLQAVPQGVVGGAFDLIYETGPLTPTINKQYGAAFTLDQQGTVIDASGVIDELGATTVAAGIGAAGPAPFVAWEFKRDGFNAPNDTNHTVQFTIEAGEGTGGISPAEFTLVGGGAAVTFLDTTQGTYELKVYLGDFNHDNAVNQFDLAVLVPKLFNPPAYDEEFDLNSDGAVNHFDLALLVARLFVPVE